MTLSENKFGNKCGRTVADIKCDNEVQERYAEIDQEEKERGVDGNIFSDVEEIQLAGASLTSRVLTGKAVATILRLQSDDNSYSDTQWNTTEEIARNTEMTSNAIKSIIEQDSTRMKNLSPDEVLEYMSSVRNNYLKNMQTIWSHLLDVKNLGLGNISYENLVRNSNSNNNQAERHPIIGLVMNVDQAFERIADEWRKNNNKVPTVGWVEYNKAVQRFVKMAITLVTTSKKIDID